QLVFLHAVKEGPANQSYGLQVARLAGVPRSVLTEARRYLGELERREHAARPPTPQQELLLAPPANATESALRRMLAGVDPESLSPRAALDVLFRLKELLDDGES
ncbi:MAG: mutS, partial [Steroidobacteraceae bacterium]|nr:mutS [Steroidobacteraceae bacterium]